MISECDVNASDQKKGWNQEKTVGYSMEVRSLFCVLHWYLALDDHGSGSAFAMSTLTEEHGSLPVITIMQPSRITRLLELLY